MAARRTALRHNEGNGATGGIWRVAEGSRSRILKVARHGEAAPGSAWVTSEDPAHFNYWRREPLAYGSGFADAAYRDGGIRAPRLEEAVTLEDGSIELWLEDVEGGDGFSFSVARLGRFGHELGVGQARWAGRVPGLDEVSWLSRGWLRQYVASGPGHDVEASEEAWTHPVAQVWPERVRASLRRLREDRMAVLARAEALPRTLCHLDCWPANLIEDPAGTTVLLDWAFVGEGAIGEDPANLIIDSVTDGLMDAALLPEIAEAVSVGYAEGLTDGGLRMPEGEVRRAIATCAVAKYNWLGAAAIGAAVRGRSGKASYNQDDSAEETLRRITGLATLLADWADGLG
ncbi:MAG TPA: phosphotransferase [Actinospica sp.]|nr:phosphotransferase [Actinospica sp.]